MPGLDLSESPLPGSSVTVIPLTVTMQRMSPRTAWFLACRPKTLTVSLAPVLVGTTTAWHDSGTLVWLPLLAALIGACLIQIGTNLFNDVGDFLAGTDTAERLGPKRATAEGWLTPNAVRRGAWLAFAGAFACGLYLAWRGGWPIVLIGIASLIAGWAYTSGPRPISRGPWGEVFVLVFFGLVAVAGSHYVQTLSLDPGALLCGLLLGVHAAAVITVNNYRDLESDQRSGRRTLAIRLGRRRTQRLYAAEILLPFGLLALLQPGLGTAVWLPLLSLPIGMRLIRRFCNEPPGPGFNGLLAQTAALQLAFSCLLLINLLFF